jgi:hypothetical protein
MKAPHLTGRRQRRHVTGAISAPLAAARGGASGRSQAQAKSPVGVLIDELERILYPPGSLLEQIVHNPTIQTVVYPLDNLRRKGRRER